MQSKDHKMVIKFGLWGREGWRGVKLW